MQTHFRKLLKMAGVNNNAGETPLEQLTATIMTAVHKVLDERQQDWGQQVSQNLMAQVNNLFASNNSEVAEQAVKKVKLDIPDLKNAGNKDKFEHNSEVSQCMEKALTCINNGEINAGNQHLQRGKQLVAKRQKLVRLADREDDGWYFVKEYVSDKLASDSEDEKAISKARKAAAGKKAKYLEEKKKTRAKNYPSSYPRQANRGTYSGYNSYNRSSSTQGWQGRSNTSVRKNDFRKDRFDRECYSCGRRGHLLYNCPNRHY